MLSVPGASAWSNGGFSTSPNSPAYGTHDWIAQHALDWLPQSEKGYILSNLNLYLYATELPDNGGAADGIGDTTHHHIYYHANGALQDDASASRARVFYLQAIAALHSGNTSGAAKSAGIMTHYIDDVAVFGHVMGAATDWGSEQHHSDYENYIEGRTNSYNDEFNTFLAFDGSLSSVTAYDGALALANDTTFDLSGSGQTAVWMDTHYDWSNTAFRDRAGESLNLAVNTVADVLHTVYEAASPNPTTTTSSQTTTPSSSATSPATSVSSGGGGIPEFPYQLTGLTVLTLVVLSSYLLLRRRLVPSGTAR